MRPTWIGDPTGAGPARAAGAANRAVPRDHEQHTSGHRTSGHGTSGHHTAGRHPGNRQYPHRDQHQEREQYA
ncbi:hypothetical protein ACFYPT_06845 [Streptomyces sp. NPDC005529]|uniref:hypothetical protein n=1 Tax=unclassified Streptomyces TaxID=2593676 RepID=UPI00339F6374